MNLSQKIQTLFNAHGETVQIGKRFGLFSRGWLWIEDNGDSWHIDVANGRTSHDPLGGSVYGIDVRKDTGERLKKPGLTGAWESAISMWPVRDEGRAEGIYRHVATRIDRAFAYHNPGFKPA